MILSDILVRVMRDRGHDVDNRIVKVGEDLSEYDVIILGIFSPFSINSKHIYGVTDTLDRYWRTEEKQVFTFVDDWTLHQIDQNSRSTRRQLTRLTRPSVFDRRPGYDWAKSAEGYEAIARVYERVTETGWPPVIMPLMGWGDPQIAMRQITAESYWPLDPVSYSPVLNATKASADERKRQWVFAIIQEHSDWLKSLQLTWDVSQFGGGMTKRDGQKLTPVTEVFQEYARSWGILSPPYKKLNGSGWWRERMVHAAMAGCVLYCDKAEAPQLGPVYQYPVHYLEEMSTSDLAAVAYWQADSLRKACWDGVRLHHEVDKLLQAAADGDNRTGLTRT